MNKPKGLALGILAPLLVLGIGCYVTDLTLTLAPSTGGAPPHGDAAADVVPPPHNSDGGPFLGDGGFQDGDAAGAEAGSADAATPLPDSGALPTCLQMYDCTACTCPSPYACRFGSCVSAIGSVAGGDLTCARTHLYKYDPNDTASDHRQATVVMSAAGSLSVIDTDLDSTSSPTFWANGTFAASGTTLTGTLTCPVTASVPWGYTATATTLKLYDTQTKRVNVYAKQ